MRQVIGRGQGPSPSGVHEIGVLAGIGRVRFEPYPWRRSEIGALGEIALPRQASAFTETSEKQPANAKPRAFVKLYAIDAVFRLAGYTSMTYPASWSSFEQAATRRA